MSSQHPKNSSLGIRHYIQEITLQPTTSRRRIELEVLVDGKTIHKIPSPTPGQPLRWDMQTFVCDLQPESKIGLKFLKNSRPFPDREVLVEYTISESTGQTSITKLSGPFPSVGFMFAQTKPDISDQDKTIQVTVKFPDSTQVANDNSANLAKASKLVEVKKGPLDRVGRARGVFDTILSFAEVVAELHPTAKLVVGLCKKAWECLGTIQQQHDDMQRLMEGLVVMQDFIEAVKGRAKEQVLSSTIIALLRLLEDTSNFIINTLSQTGVAETIRGLVDTQSSDKITGLLQKFEELKESFDRAVGVGTFNQVLTIAQRALLDRLKPTPGSHYSGTRPCQDNTRSEVLNDICTWCEDPSTSSKLLWLYGHAGMGKSSIASSVCRQFNGQGTLGAPFFCKRDNPELRTPESILNSLVYDLASQYEPYGQAVSSAIESNIRLPDSPLEQRYTSLVVQPLQALKSAGAMPSKTYLVVVDALDECEKGSNRRLLLTYLREMSMIVPWIKVLVTSRPDLDIRKAFEASGDGSVDSRSLLAYDASDDIFKFTRRRMSDIAESKDLTDWPDELIRLLSTRASGLFIWVETACKFIEQGSDMDTCLSEVLEGTTPKEGSEPLDALYTTAITQSMGNQGNDNVRNIRNCLGAIVATASRTPLSVASLEWLLSRQKKNESLSPSHMKSDSIELSLLGRREPSVVRNVVNNLSSVLYEDQSQGGAVRVYHPSFADFILDSARSGKLHTDPQEQNAVLADCCLKTMLSDLKFNICGLKTSHVRNRDISDLNSRVQKVFGRKIRQRAAENLDAQGQQGEAMGQGAWLAKSPSPQHLAYSCMYWTSHLTETPESTHRDRVDEFLHSPKLLFWIEALSLLGELDVALSSLQGLVAWAVAEMGNISSYANDGCRFVLTFYDAISESTPHLYISALAFAPTRSKVAQQMRHLFPNTFMITGGGNESWPSWLQSMAHNEQVYSVACSGDGRRIVSACQDGMVRIWDSETGATVSEPLESPSICCVAITSEGRHIASASRDGTVRVWNAETSALLCEPFKGQRNSLRSITFSPNGHRVFTGHEDGTVQVWDTGSGTKLSELHLEHSDLVWFIALSPDGQHIASSFRDVAVRVWDSETGAPVTEPLTGHSGAVNCVAFSPNGRLLASGSYDNTVRLWDVNTSAALHQPMTGHSRSVTSVAFSPNGRHLVSGSDDKTVRVWNVEDGMPLGEPLVAHADSVTSVAFCSNGRRVVSASGKTVRIWDVGADITTSMAPFGHSVGVNSVAFSANGRYLVSGSEDGTIRIWDAHTGAEAFKPLTSNSGYIHSALFTPDNRRIISLVGDKTVQVWDVETGVLATEFPLGNSDRVRSISLSLDGRRIASGSEDGTIGLWDADTGTAVFPQLAGHLNWVRSVALSPDGHLIASGSDDCTVQIWAAETGAAVGEPLSGHLDWVLSVCFSPNSRRIASGSGDNTIRVWGTTTCTSLLEPLHGHSGEVSSVVFSSDGRYVISGSADWTVRIWDVDTGAAVAEPLLGHSGWVLSVAVSPDGSHIASGSVDASVRIWDVEAAFAEPDQLITEPLSAPLPLSLSTSYFASYVTESGWVTSSDGALLLWLPKDCRHTDKSAIQISADPLLSRHLRLDFSKFVHGDSWESVFAEGPSAAA